jgi:diguanylate cyclase (GGDEF)-like protein
MAAGRYSQRERRMAAQTVLLVGLVAVLAIALRARIQASHAVIIAITALVELAIIVPMTRVLAERRARREATAAHPSSRLGTVGAQPRDAIVQSVELALANDASAAVLLLDLDGFKLVNEAFGHDVGDHLIETMIGRLDTVAGSIDEVFHLGGDEFGIVLRGPIGLVAASDRAGFLADIVAAPLTIVGIELAVTASIGVALASRDDDAVAVIDHASTAVHRAKRLGGRRVVLYDEALRTEARDRLALGAALRHAVERDELIVEFQTINHVTDGTPFAMEALVRWQHPTLGLLSPERFIPLAEDTGAITAIGRWVLDASCRQLVQLDQQFSEAGQATFDLWVNVSPKQLGSLDFVTDVRSILATHGIAASRLTMEITENSLIDDVDGASAVLHALKALGLQIAIDDFGTGFSALSYLNQLPIDILKIDRRFVSAVSAGGDSSVLANVISLGHDKGLMVIAEGVETMEQRNVLRRLGCEAAQGWYFSRPVVSPEVGRRVLADRVRLRG